MRRIKGITFFPTCLACHHELAVCSLIPLPRPPQTPKKEEGESPGLCIHQKSDRDRERLYNLQYQVFQEPRTKRGVIRASDVLYRKDGDSGIRTQNE
jgi:hypothetical protein